MASVVMGPLKVWTDRPCALRNVMVSPGVLCMRAVVLFTADHPYPSFPHAAAMRSEEKGGAVLFVCDSHRYDVNCESDAVTGVILI